MRPILPTGVASLLSTDIEGSTRLLAERMTDDVDALGAQRQTLERACSAADGPRARLLTQEYPSPVA